MPHRRATLVRRCTIVATTITTLVVTAAPVGAGRLATATLTGTVTTPSATRSATLRLECQPDRGGVLELELQVPEAQTVRDFDFEPFEGPDAPAAARALSSIAAHAAGDDRRAAVRRAAAGWYAADDPSAFVLGVSQRSRRSGDLATFVGTIDERTRVITWTQRGYRRREQTLTGTFEVDPESGRRWHRVAAPCLP